MEIHKPDDKVFSFDSYPGWADSISGNLGAVYPFYDVKGGRLPLLSSRV